MTATDEADTPQDPAEEQRPLLLVIGTGDRNYREYLLKSISREYRLHLFVGASPSWEHAYIQDWTVLDLTDTRGADQMIEAARALAATTRIRGVLSWDEARVLQSAMVAEALGLPGGDPGMVMRCRDKYLTRQALEAAAVPQPRSVMVTSVDKALAVAAEIGYPVVLKPRALAASLGVVRVDSPQELGQQFSFARDTTVPGAWHYDVVLVEEYLTGPEISVDSAVFQGQTTPMFLARKEVGYPPYFEEIGHVVDAADPMLKDPELVRIVQDTHTALGYTDGITHTELKLTPDGPKIIEVNARLGGDLIPYLGQQSTGVQPGLAAAAIACGQPPQVVADRSLVGAVRFFYVAENDTTVGSVRFADTGLPDALDSTAVLAKAGDVVSPPPLGTTFGRIALATAVAGSAEQCQQALDAAEAALIVE